jgi:NitT/TauT family transport system substrate-binding protein
MKKRTLRHASVVAGAAAIVWASLGAIANAAEKTDIVITKQPSILYLPAIVMEKQKLIEKQAAAQGVPNLKVEWRMFSGGGAATDALLSNNVDIVNSGLGNLLLLWDRTRGKVKGIVTNSSQPVLLISRDPSIKTIKDFTPTDKIAVPTVRISTQAILLQMAAEQTFGKGQWGRLDPNTVQLGHPDAAAALSNSKHEVANHFSAPPFDFQELRRVPGAHVVLNSSDVIKGGLSQSTLFTTTTFANDNPKIVKAVIAASKQAVAYVKDHTRESVEMYKELSGDRSSVDDLMVMMKQPGMMNFGTAPAGSMKFAEHMHMVGILKSEPKAWTDYFLPVSADLNGN